MPSRANSQNIGTALGTLLGAFLRGREEEQYERELKELLEQQRRDVEASHLQGGRIQGPPRPVMPPTPPPQRSFGEMLMGIPGQIGAGLTPSSPAIYGLEERYKTGQEELQRARTLEDLFARTKAEEEARFERMKALKSIPQATLASPREAAFERLSEAEKKQALLGREPRGPMPGFNERLYNSLDEAGKKAYREKFMGIGAKPPPSDVPLLNEQQDLEDRKAIFAYNLTREKNPLKGDEAVLAYQGLKSNIDQWNSRHPEFWVDLPPYSPETPGSWNPFNWKSGTPAKLGPGIAPVAPPVPPSVAPPSAEKPTIKEQPDGTFLLPTGEKISLQTLQEMFDAGLLPRDIPVK